MPDNQFHTDRAEPPLFGAEVFDLDSARARRSDPDTSHLAADKSSKKLSQLQAIVLFLFMVHGEGLTDTELDDLYASNWERKNWPRVRMDTPRKRRSDLTRLGRLEDSTVRRMSRHGSLEAVWVAPDHYGAAEVDAS
jgi:hypothetical protein